jgi:hypothetical protein
MATARLRNWNTRTATLDINGERTAPYPIPKGVPRGNVLSPWLCNLFLESLLRVIQQDDSSSDSEGNWGVAGASRSLCMQTTSWC